MALEAVVFQQDPFGYGSKDFYTLGGGPWSYAFDFEKEIKAYKTGFANLNADDRWEYSSLSSMVPTLKERDRTNSSSQENCTGDGQLAAGGFSPVEAPAAMSCRRKRRRTKTAKNKEEVENQRMTHIAVERNRRKQMNDYLALLRSMMPPSYVQRGDQASIIGGAINFVKELEQLVQSLEVEAHKRIQQRSQPTSSSLFSDFFSCPQYSADSTDQHNNSAEKPSSNVADVEVTMVESHANLKILTRKRPKQLFKMVAGLHSLGLVVLHLNVTPAADPTVLYSFSVKVEDDCQLTSVNEIAAAVYEMVGRIHEEAAFS